MSKPYNPQAFLHSNCKPLMKWFYKLWYKDDIYKMLGIFYDYRKIPNGIQQEQLGIIYDILEYDGWTRKRAIKTFGYCMYCGLIQKVNSSLN